MSDNYLNKSKDIAKKLEDIMKCEKCNKKYDYNIHKPMVVKCGHTFCKYCIKNNNEKKSNNIDYIDNKQKRIFVCPIDGIQHTFNTEINLTSNEPTIYPNLKLELILKEILHISEPAIKEKYIVYTKPDMKRNKSPENSKNTFNNSDGSNIKNRSGSDYNKAKKNKNINIKINSGNQIINVNAINVNIDTREIIKKEEKQKKINDLDKNNNNNNNKNNNNNNNNNNINNNDSMLNDDLNN